MSIGLKVFARRHRIISAVIITVAGVLLLTGLVVATVATQPALAAQGAEILRGVIGDENVAKLETVVLGIQDTLQSLAFRTGTAQPAAPWPSPIPATPSDIPPSATLVVLPTQGQASPTAGPSQTPAPQATAAPPTATAMPANLPAPLKPLGSLAGEGQWSAYLSGSAGQALGYKTFLQPDAQRPYAVAAIVAIDLSATRLHFVLGTDEPVSPATIDRPGKIPPSDLKSGVLLAVFNGGFQARHGNFGAMVNGIMILPPRPGFATVALYRDGHVAIGAWGTTITQTNDLRTWRQNGPLIIQGGQINPHTADDAPRDWGFTVKDVTATWRSGLAISPDGRTLYYVAGTYLTLPALAQVMADTGAAQALQLDINGYWVQFEAVRFSASVPEASPLLVGMKQDGRYLNGFGFSRDFFYVTADGG
jgi:hypothetical protein